MKPEQLRELQDLPLEHKINYTKFKIIEFVEQCGRDVCIQKSGLDSSVLHDIAISIYPDLPVFFVDTGLEDPSVVINAEQTKNITIIKPDVSFHEVISQHGYPTISKDVSRALSDIQNPTPRNEATRRLRLTGVKKDGTKGKSGSYLPAKYHNLIQCGFRFSDKCCYFLKHKPAEKIHHKLKYSPLIGTLAEDSSKRTRAALQTGCNNFTSKIPISKPLTIWTRQDIYQYAIQEKIKYPSCYGEIVEISKGIYEPSGEKHTGCQFCLFGILHDPMRIERLRYQYPSRYKYCMETLNYKTLLPLLLGHSLEIQQELF